MSRIRAIKPEFYKHEGLFDLEQDLALPVRLAFSGLWTCCDREGRFKWRPRELKADILPHDSLDFSRVLDALWTRGFIQKYRADGQDYGYIPSWHKHQIINNRESKSILPVPTEGFIIQPVDALTTREPRVDNARATENQDGQEERKGKEGKGRELKPSARRARGGINNSALAKATGETRHTRIQQIIMGWYFEWAGVECPWNGQEGKHLSAMITSTPNWPDAQFIICLDHLAQSACVPRGDRPGSWLEKLPKFLHGPLDQFWHPTGGKTNGKLTSQQSREGTTRAAEAAVDKFLRRKNAVGSEDVPGSTAPGTGNPS